MEQQQSVEEQSLAILDQATATANLPRQVHFQVIGALQCLKKLVESRKIEEAAIRAAPPPTPQKKA